MLISSNPPFLFLHIDKAAGTSIQAALRPFAAPKSNNRIRRRQISLGGINRFFNLHRRVEFPEHVHAQAVKKCLPSKVYAELFKFAFVRNPWDRLVSRYAYLLRVERHARHGHVKAMSGFPDFLEWELQRGKMFQYSYVCDARGHWIVDFIGYFERLQTDFAEICEKLQLRAELPLRNVTSHKDYRTYYTPATRDLVAKYFKRDIELFGYEFDGLPATAVPKGLKANV